MSVKLAALVTYLTHDVPQRDSIPSDMQYEECVKRAVADFSRRKPLVKETTISIEPNVASYTLPTDFLFVIEVEPLMVGYGGIMVAPGGLTPLSSSFQEVYTVTSGEITVVPTPTYACDRRVWYAALYLLDATGQEYAELPENLVDVVLLKARALATGIKAARAADEAWQYSVGDERVSKERLAESLRAEVKRLTEEYEGAVRSQTRNVGIKSTYLGQTYDGAVGIY